MIVIRVKMINELEAINSVNLQSIICNNDTLRSMKTKVSTFWRVH